MSNAGKEIIFDCDCTSREKAFEVLAILCRATKYFCYNPSDFSEAILSLTWAETLQYINEDCVNDVQCAFNILQSFMESLNLAFSRKYVIKIYIDKVKDILNKLEFVTYDKM